MTTGDPKITLRITVLLGLLGAILAGVSAWVSINVAIARTETTAKLTASDTVARHESLKPHVDPDEIRLLREDVRAIRTKLDQVAEDVAVLKARGTKR